MSGEQSWVKEGAECICIKDVWWGAFGPLPRERCPTFMQQYTVKHIDWLSDQPEGHRIKIAINSPIEGQWDMWCACGFRPVVKIEDEEEIQTTVPITPEKVPEKVS